MNFRTGGGGQKGGPSKVGGVGGLLKDFSMDFSLIEALMIHALIIRDCQVPVIYIDT